MTEKTNEQTKKALGILLRLEREVMNLPIEVGGPTVTTDVFYRGGHEDARCDVVKLIVAARAELLKGGE